MGIDLYLSFRNNTLVNYEYIYDGLYYLKIIGLEKYELLIDPNYSERVIPEAHCVIKRDNVDIDNNKLSEYIKDIKKEEGEKITIFKKNVKKCVNDHFNQELNDKIVERIITVNDKKLYVINQESLLLTDDIIKKKKYIRNGCIYNKPIKIF